MNDTIKVEYKCRLCQLPGQVDVPSDFGGLVTMLQAASGVGDRFLAAKYGGLLSHLEGCARLLCHHRCYTIWETMRVTERLIYWFAGEIERALDDKRKVRCKAKLTVVFDRWRENECRRFRVTPSEYVTSEAVDAIASGARVDVVLRDSRDRIRHLQRDVNYWEVREAELDRA